MSKKKKEEKEVKTLTAKEIKDLCRPDFEANPDKYYPVTTFKKLGYSRSRCEKCKKYFWRHSDSQKTCGDSACVGKYEFIGRGTGIGRDGKTRITYADAWKTFEKSLTTARIPATAIERYPVVARWRSDVDYVAAGIYCFQPYCVTGELDPPANPLICPQFCVRFNDLDNIGITGRHYSGFIMLGIQVFNYPGQFHYFKEECLEFNYNWLVNELGITPDEITFIEDVWAGGGNCGPCIEYFVGGLEIGDMVFTQFKTYHDGTLEELPTTIIDTGIGLERIPWLINGTATSYMDTFKHSFEITAKKLGLNLNDKMWEKFGPYSCLLNIDEVDDIEKTWKFIADTIGEDTQKVKEMIEPIKDVYILLDHLRSVFMIINDGSLPSNVGGGSNVRNVIRRIFSILKKQKWEDKIGVKEMMEIIEGHCKDMEGIYGKIELNPKLADIIEIEYERWKTTDKDQKQKLDKLAKKKGGLTLDDWIVAIQSYGIPADRISEFTGKPVPGNLYYEIAQREERIFKGAEEILYDTTSIPETVAIFDQDNYQDSSKGKIIEIFTNLDANSPLNGKNNLVILDQSVFYPTQGGQECDHGILTIEGKEYKVIDCIKVGKCAVHVLDQELPGDKKDYIGKEVSCKIDMERRRQLMTHHTATHIVCAACKRVLGPHVWQNGAKKTEEMAHLDITHYKSLTYEEEREIQNMANKIVLEGHNITKSWINKAEAEKKYGFTLYQGGVVPGNQLRVVNINDVDIEACCGTHRDNTNEVGYIKLIKSKRISDGIVRLYYVAGKKSLDELDEDSKVIHQLEDLWGVERSVIFQTADRFFSENKKYQTKLKKQSEKLIEFEIKSMVGEEDIKVGTIKSDEANSQMYFTNCPQHLSHLVKAKKGIIYYNEGFIYGLFGDKSLINEKEFKTFCEKFKSKETKEEKKEDKKKEDKKEDKKEEKKENKFKYACQDKLTVGKKNVIKDIYQISCFTNFNIKELQDKFKELGFKEIE